MTTKQPQTYRTILSGYIPADDNKGTETQIIFQVMSGPDKGKLLTIPAKFYVPPAEREARSLRQCCIDTLMLKFGDADTTKHFAHWVDTKTRSGWRRYSSTEHSLALPIRRDQLIEDYEAFCRTEL